MEKYKLKQAFNNLVLNSMRVSKGFLENIKSQRGFLLQRKLTNVVKRGKKKSFDQICNYSQYIKSYVKLRVISVIGSRYLKNLKQIFFSKISRIMLKGTNRTHNNHEISDLKVQIQDMGIQL
jgi:hypothetical protein